MRCLKIDRDCLFVVVVVVGTRERYTGYGCIGGIYLQLLVFFAVFFFGWLLSVFIAFDFGGFLFFVVVVFFFFLGLHCTHSVKERKTKKSSRRKKGRKGNTQKNIFCWFLSFLFFFFGLHTNIIVID